MLKIKWTENIKGLDLYPTWEAEKIRLHTVKNMLQPDQSTRKDTIVLAVIFNAEQIRKITAEFGEGTIPFNMLGSVVIPLFPNAVLWDYKPPKQYERVIPVAKYTSFEIVEDELG